MAAQDEELREMYINLKSNTISEGTTLHNTLTRPGSPEKRKEGTMSEGKTLRNNQTRLGSAEIRKEAHHRPGAKMPKETACERLVTYGGRVKSQAQPDLKSQAQPDQPDLKS